MPNNNVLTYANQPDNVGAWRLGEACRAAKAGGDPIDHGLSLLKELQARGYGIVSLTAHPGQPEPSEDATARIERLRKALLEARDAMRVMANWVKKSDPAGHAWGVHMVDQANAALNGQPEPRAEVTDEQIADMFERVTGYSIENGRAALNDADILGFARELLDAAREGGV